jgi:hypothetical protein
MHYVACFATILAAMSLSLSPGWAEDDNPSAQAPHKEFSTWISERVSLEREQHGFHRNAHENKLAEKRGMNIPDGKYASDELTFDDTFQAPDDPEQWPLWRLWQIHTE